MGSWALTKWLQLAPTELNVPSVTLVVRIHAAPRLLKLPCRTQKTAVTWALQLGISSRGALTSGMLHLLQTSGMCELEHSAPHLVQSKDQKAADRAHVSDRLHALARVRHSQPLPVDDEVSKPAGSICEDDDRNPREYSIQRRSLDVGAMNITVVCGEPEEVEEVANACLPHSRQFRHDVAFSCIIAAHTYSCPLEKA